MVGIFQFAMPPPSSPGPSDASGVANWPRPKATSKVMNIDSMDWFKGKSQPETMVFTIKYGGFPVNFPLNQSID